MNVMNRDGIRVLNMPGSRDIEFKERERDRGREDAGFRLLAYKVEGS